MLATNMKTTPTKYFHSNFEKPIRYQVQNFDYFQNQIPIPAPATIQIQVQICISPACYNGEQKRTTLFPFVMSPIFFS